MIDHLIRQDAKDLADALRYIDYHVIEQLLEAIEKLEVKIDLLIEQHANEIEELDNLRCNLQEDFFNSELERLHLLEAIKLLNDELDLSRQKV